MVTTAERQETAQTEPMRVNLHKRESHAARQPARRSGIGGTIAGEWSLKETRMHVALLSVSDRVFIPQYARLALWPWGGDLAISVNYAKAE